jgi:hypothetical protein
MSSEEEEKKNQVTTPPVDGFDGYTAQVEGVDDDLPASGRLIQGTMLKFTNTAAWITRNDEEVPSTLELVPVDVLRVAQKWIDKQPVETRIIPPNEKVPDIKALNADCPREEWGEYQGKLVGPWQFQNIVYLIDLVTMDRYTWPTGTVGGIICVRELADKTKLMRRFRGQHVYAVVTLSDIFMNTRFGGRQRPHLIVKRWVQMGEPTPALAKPTEPTLPPAKTEALPGLKVVTEPSLAEQMGGDEIPFNDSPDPDVPVQVTTPVVPRKPAAPSKPAVTKRGVQKIAGGGSR